MTCSSTCQFNYQTGRRSSMRFSCVFMIRQFPSASPPLLSPPSHGLSRVTSSFRHIDTSLLLPLSPSAHGNGIRSPHGIDYLPPFHASVSDHWALKKSCPQAPLEPPESSIYVWAGSARSRMLQIDNFSVKWRTVMELKIVIRRNLSGPWTQQSETQGRCRDMPDVSL